MSSFLKLELSFSICRPKNSQPLLSIRVHKAALLRPCAQRSGPSVGPTLTQVGSMGRDAPHCQLAGELRRSCCPIPLPESHLLRAEAPGPRHSKMHGDTRSVSSPHVVGQHQVTGAACACTTPAMALLLDTVALPILPVCPDLQLCLLSIMGKSRPLRFGEGFLGSQAGLRVTAVEGQWQSGMCWYSLLLTSL